MTYQLEHLQNEHRFEYRSVHGIAVCEYQIKDGAWVLVHTTVPVSMRGQGVAGILVRYALEQARLHGRKVIPVCSYVATYIKRHAEFAGLLANPTDRSL